MPRLREVLADLHPFSLLRDCSSGNVRPVRRVLQLDDALDPERYMRTGISPVKILRLVDDDTPDPVPVLEEVLLDCHLDEVVRGRLSEPACAWLAEHIELVCHHAQSMVKEAQRYLNAVPRDLMEKAAVQALFAVALAKDRSEGVPAFPDTIELVRYVRPEIHQALKAALVDARQEAERILEAAQDKARYASDCLRGLVPNASELRRENTKGVPAHQLRDTAARLAEQILAAAERIERKIPDDETTIPELAASFRRRRSRTRCRLS